MLGMEARRLAATLVASLLACSEPFEAGAPTDLDSSTGLTEADASEPMDALEQDEEANAPDRSGPDGTADAHAEADAAPGLPVTRDLFLWLRADIGVTEERGAVSNWADQSGNHLDARQPDTSRQPTWVGAGLSGRPVLVFDGEDFLSLPDGFADFSLGVSVFVVVIADRPETCVDILHLSNGAEIDDIAVGRHDGQGQYEVYTDTVRTNDFPLDTPQLVSVVHAPDSNVTLRRNAEPFATANFALPATITRLSNVVGRSLYANCTSWNGGISEVILYRRALATDERNRVENYLRTQWSCCR